MEAEKKKADDAKKRQQKFRKQRKELLGEDTYKALMARRVAHTLQRAKWFKSRCGPWAPSPGSEPLREMPSTPKFRESVSFFSPTPHSRPLGLF